MTTLMCLIYTGYILTQQTLTWLARARESALDYKASPPPQESHPSPSVPK